MDIRVLRYFLTVVREENISKAAQALHVTQPTLSRQMAQLEDELGAPLFVRGKRLTLTDAGMLLRRRAEEVTELMDRIEDEFASREEVGGIISIGSGVLKSSHILVEKLLAFREMYPEVQYEIYTNTSDYVKRGWIRGFWILDCSWNRWTSAGMTTSVFGKRRGGGFSYRKAIRWRKRAGSQKRN